ncbi:CLIP-associated protein [Zea mays]|uniref:CLIP-associated protein n=1 Tax=Zea mays TaxID=4577 RepID=A0A3L6F2U7_MAIZE|nr:CLIP-associated protein [Zea mays]PWZ27435.1 CLIP-associated protein [Zea mays]
MEAALEAARAKDTKERLARVERLHEALNAAACRGLTTTEVTALVRSTPTSASPRAASRRSPPPPSSAATTSRSTSTPSSWPPSNASATASSPFTTPHDSSSLL